MDIFRWKRTILRASAPALLCAMLAGWGVYVLTADERPTYRTFALLNTGIMSNRDIGGAYNRDLVINELENIMNLARSFETRQELSARLLAKFISLRAPNSNIISERAFDDMHAEIDSSIIIRHGHYRNVELIYNSIVTERDSLRRYGEQMAEHPLLELLYGDNALVGAEQLATLKVNRKGMSDLLELSYSTNDAAWAKLTLDTHIEIFLKAHRTIKETKRGNALAYFQEATDRSREVLNQKEEELRRFATKNKIINYYEQTRFLASVKNQVDQRYMEERMVQAAADSTVDALEQKLASRLDLVRLNQIVDQKKLELGALSKEQVRLEIMQPDSVAQADGRLEEITQKIQALRRELSDEVGNLQEVYNGPEGLELGKLITEWLAATLMAEEAKGRIEILQDRRNDFNRIYTDMADLGTTIKKIEREVHIAEEDYLENLSNLNEALQKQYEQESTTDLRLVDEPVLPAKSDKSSRTILVAVAFILGFVFPIVLAIAMELLSNALLSFAEAEKRSGLLVVGAVPRWGLVQKIFRKGSRQALRATTTDLLWQGLKSRGEFNTNGFGPQIIVVASFRPGAGKGYVIDLIAERLSQRRLRICVASGRSSQANTYFGVTHCVVDGVRALGNFAGPYELIGLTYEQWNSYDVILWELPALVTGRIPVDIARMSQDALLVHPANAGWSKANTAALAQLKDAIGGVPRLVLNGIPLDVLLNEWGSTIKQIKQWKNAEEEANRPAIGGGFYDLANPSGSFGRDSEGATASPPPESAPVLNVSDLEPSNLDAELSAFTPIEASRWSLPEEPTTPPRFEPVRMGGENDEDEEEDALANSTELTDSITPLTGNPEPIHTDDWEQSLSESLGVVQDEDDWEEQLKKS